MGGNGLFLGANSDARVEILPRMANRHGLIAGATGTGKTVSLRVMAEAFSKIGVPTIVADVKGDLSGLARAGAPHPKIDQRAADLGLNDFRYEGQPVVFWDVFGKKGHPFRATVSELGPLLLSRLLELTPAQEATLYVAFRVADDQGLLLLDLKDLRAMINFIDEHRDRIGREYGRVNTASCAAIQRGLLVLEEQGADRFFGEPVVRIEDLMLQDMAGNGIINVLAADRLVSSPKMYSTVLLWLLSEMFEQLPEVGDPEKPRMLFFFDEAHLLFDDAPKALVDKVEQVCRLIRSKGVGVYFVTQNPLDIPDEVLGQLGNRIQHALRAYTPRDQKAVRAAAETFRPNPSLDVEAAIGMLGVGEALVSTLDAKGVPAPVQQVLIRPPESRLDLITDEERTAVMRASPVGQRYDKEIDRESAFEMLFDRAERTVAEASPDDEVEIAPGKTARRANPWGVPLPEGDTTPSGPGAEEGGAGGGSDDAPTSRERPRGRVPSTRKREAEPETPPEKSNSSLGGWLGDILGTNQPQKGRSRQSLGEAFAKSAVRSVGSAIGRRIARGILGGIFKR